MRPNRGAPTRGACPAQEPSSAWRQLSRVLRIQSPSSALCVFAVLATLVCTAITSAETPSTDTAPHSNEATDPISALRPFLGNWEIQSQWADGSKIWSRNEFVMGLGDKFIEVRTFAKDGDGEPYERYRTVYAHEATTGKLRSYSFNKDGGVTVAEVILDRVQGRPSLTSGWSQGDGKVKQTVTLVSADRFRWQVWVGAPDGGWSQVMDGEWKRVD